MCVGRNKGIRSATYTTGLASANIVRQASDVVRVAHENGGLHGGEGCSGQGCARSAAEGVVHDLPSLRVPDQHDLGVWALAFVSTLITSGKYGVLYPLVEARDSLDHGSCTLRSGVLVADATTLALSSASRVDNRLRGGPGVCLCHHVDESLTRAVALGHSCLTGTKDVDLGTVALALLDVGGCGLGEAHEKRED